MKLLKLGFFCKAIALALLTLAAACSKEPAAQARRGELTVYAAASTRDGLTAINQLFEAESAATIVVNFGSSGDLSRQILAAAKADVFLSADAKEMDRVEQAQLLRAGTRRDLLSNQLVVIEPASAASSLALDFDPAVLASSKVEHVSLANVESVPAGRYAKAWLESRNAWTGVAPKVVPAVDVRAALAAVEAGAAEAGIVYRTDVARSTKARIVFAVPAGEGPKIVYPVATIAGRENESVARAYVEFLGSERARAIWQHEGFTFPEAADKSR